MTNLKYAFVALSLGTALAIPTAALANNSHNSHSNHHEQDNHKHNKHNDKHNHKSGHNDRDNKDCDADEGGQGGDVEPTPTPTPTPTPVVSDSEGVVLAAATTPATLPVTGADGGLVFVIAGGSSLATYLLMKRRSLV